MPDDILKRVLEIAVEIDKIRQELRREHMKLTIASEHHKPVITQMQLNEFVRICQERADAAIVIAPILFGSEFEWMPRDGARRILDLLHALPPWPNPHTPASSRRRSSRSSRTGV